MLPFAVEKLADSLRGFPGVGRRSSVKLALDILELSKEDYNKLIDNMEEVKSKVDFCDNCGFFAEKIEEDSKLLCEICKSKRNALQICLVEKPTDVITVEKSQIFRGVYHVLEKLISPLDNIFADDTTISYLVNERIPNILNKNQNTEVEIILFFKAGFAADATTAYLKELISSKNLTDKVNITRMAQGLPLYFNPDTLDQATIAKAIEDRRII